MRAGTNLGPYVLECELGSGGMGQVYAATVEGRCPGIEAGTRVALKVVHEHLLETPGFFKRFLREGEIGKAVRHPNVVRTLDCDAVGNRMFLVMEYVEGQTLRQLLDELERVPEELCRHIGREVAKGLAAIHDARAVHRDLKPENVLITAQHVVKVMDLGVARLADETMRLSRSGVFVGSVEYAAPEQFGGEVDHRCDLHSLGVLLYELACGRHPYRGDTFAQVMKRIREDPPRRLGEMNPQLSPFFEEVVHTLLAKAPEDRFASAAALYSALEAGEESSWWRERASAIRATSNRPLRRIRIPRETAVYGRDDELVLLRSLFERASAGEGQVALVEGEAGIGKSRLVDEFVASLQREGLPLNFLFGSYPPGGASSTAGAFSTAFREHLGTDGAAQVLPETPLLIPAFDAVLRGDAAPAGTQPLAKDSLATCFVQAVRTLAADRPTILLVDDLHFAPAEARALFLALALAISGHRALLIGTARPSSEVEGDWRANLTRLGHTTQVRLERLFPKDLALLLRDSFRSERLAEKLAFQIATKSDGNPFFVFEIVRGLREGQLIAKTDDGSWASTGEIDEIKIPSSVLDLVNARVAGLSEDERALLDIAACWGFEFDPSLVGAVLGQRRIATLRTFGQIERRHRVVRSVGRSYVFDHHQVREALYGSLNEQLREEYHAALAEALESRAGAKETDPEELEGGLCLELCRHYLTGARGRQAVRYLPQALEHSNLGHLYAQTVALADTALALPGLLTGPGRAEVLLKLCRPNQALTRVGDFERLHEVALEVAAIATASADDDMKCSALISIGCGHLSRSHLGKAEEILLEADELARSIDDRASEGAIAANLGVVYLQQGRHADAEERCGRGLALSQEVGDLDLEASCTGNLAVVFQETNRFDQVREFAQRSLDISRAIGSRRIEVHAHAHLAAICRHESRFAEARAHLERQIELSRETGGRMAEAVAYINLGTFFWEFGDRVRARDCLERSLEICRAVGARYPEGYALLALCAVAAESGYSEDAERHATLALELRRDIGHRDGIAQALFELGDLRRRAGDHEGARGFLRESAEVSRELTSRVFAAQALAALACLPGESADEALRAFGEIDEGAASAALRFLLWTATGDRSHLAAAKRIFEDAIANAPEEFRESMRTDVRINREILAACEEQGL